MTGALLEWRLVVPAQDRALPSERITSIRQQIQVLLAEWKPGVIVLEKPAPGSQRKRPAGALDGLIAELKQVRDAIRPKVQRASYLPGEWRATSVGYGGAGKVWTAQVLFVKYEDLADVPGWDATPEPPDQWDAIGLAKCWWERHRDPALTEMEDAAKRGELVRVRGGRTS